VQEFKTNTVKMLQLKEISYKNQLRNCQQWRCVDYFLRVDYLTISRLISS